MRLFFLALTLMSASLRATPLPLKDYLKEYLGSDETLKVKMLDWRAALEQKKKETDFYSGLLTLKPQHQTTSAEYSQTRAETELSWLDVEYTQNTSVGLELKAYSSHFAYAKAPSSTTQTTYKYGLILSQNLWKDAFGQLSRLSAEAAEKQVELKAASLNLQHAESCKTGVSLYLEAQANQAKKDVVEEQLKISRRALRFSKRAYENKQLLKIDWLGAQADYLALQSRVLEASSLHETSLTKLFSPLGRMVSDPKLSRPQFSFESKVQKEIDEHPEVQEAMINLNLKKANLEKERNAQRNSIQLGAQIERSNTDALINSDLENIDNQSFTVFLKADWSLFNHSKKAAVETAHLELESAKWQLKKQRKDSQASRSITSINQRSLEEQQKQAREKIRLQKERVEQALKYLNSGRIEFNDYQRIRELLLNEEVNSIDLSLKLSSSLIQSAFDNGWLDQSCGGLL